MQVHWRTASCAFVLLAPLAALALPRSITLRESIDLALDRNAELLTFAADVAAANARLSGASTLLPTNPEASVAAGPRRSTGGGSTDIAVEVSQRLEIAGQRGLRIDVARADVAAAEARLNARKAEVAAGVREAFARALAAGAQLELAGFAAELARSALQASEHRRTAGAASQIETNTARVEVGRAVREQLAAERRRASAIGELKLLLAVLPSDDLAPQGPFAAPPPRAPAAAAAALLERARANRADLRAAQYEVAAARAERSLAIREIVPSPRVGISIRHEEEATITQGTLALELPVFARNQAARGAAAAREQRASVALAAIERTIAQELALAVSRYENAVRAASLYQGDVLAASEQNLALMTEAYRAGKIDFLQLVVLRRSSIDARLGYVESLVELYEADAELDRVLGRVP